MSKGRKLLLLRIVFFCSLWASSLVVAEGFSDVRGIEVGNESATALAPLQVADAWFRIMPPGQGVTSAYLVITNNGEQPVTLTGLHSSAAGSVELHQHLHENGMMKMRRVQQMTLAAGEQLVLQPGGYHLMLFGLRDGLSHGDKITIDITTAAGSKTSFEATGRSAARPN